MKRDLGLYLEDILESIKRIEEYTRHINEKDFKENIEVQDAIIRRFEIIGEAVKNIPPDFKNNHPEVLWKEIAGMRDVLIHGYYEVNLETIWDTIKNNLPEFKKQLESLPELSEA